MKKICIVSIPRTGTNYLCTLLNKHENIYGKYEIFHKNNPFSIQDNEFNGFIEKIGLPISNRENKEKALIARTHPSELLNYLIQNSKKNILSYKIFPAHLDKTILIEQIIKDKDTVFLICKRKVIDSYISNVKAEVLSTYVKADTTNIKPKLEFDKYKKWYINREKWYRFIENTLKEYDKKVETIYYEDFTRGDDTANLNTILTHIEKLDIKAGKLDIIDNTNFIKQDQNSDYIKKVENWEEFYNEACKEGWENKIDNYFNE